MLLTLGAIVSFRLFSYDPRALRLDILQMKLLESREVCEEWFKARLINAKPARGRLKKRVSVRDIAKRAGIAILIGLVKL